MQPTPPDSRSPLLKLYRWGRRHRWLAWAWVGLGAVGVVVVSISVISGAIRLNQAATTDNLTSTTQPAGSTTKPEQPLDGVAFDWNGKRYSIAIRKVDIMTSTDQERYPDHLNYGNLTPGKAFVGAEIEFTNRESRLGVPLTSPGSFGLAFKLADGLSCASQNLTTAPDNPQLCMTDVSGFYFDNAGNSNAQVTAGKTMRGYIRSDFFATNATKVEDVGVYVRAVGAANSPGGNSISLTPYTRIPVGK